MLLVSDTHIQSLTYHPQSCTLESIYYTFKYYGEISISLGIDNTPYDTGSCFHEAGYDSYITGYCFSKMLYYFPVYELEKYQNKLYSHKSVYTVNLSGEDELPPNVMLSDKSKPIDNCLYWKIG